MNIANANNAANNMNMAMAGRRRRLENSINTTSELETQPQSQTLKIGYISENSEKSVNSEVTKIKPVKKSTSLIQNILSHVNFFGRRRRDTTEESQKTENKNNWLNGIADDLEGGLHFVALSYVNQIFQIHKRGVQLSDENSLCSLHYKMSDLGDIYSKVSQVFLVKSLQIINSGITDC